MGAHRQGSPRAPPPQGRVVARAAAADTPLAVAPPVRVAELPVGKPAPRRPVRAAWAVRRRRPRAARPPPAAVTAASGRGRPSARARTRRRLRPTPRWPRRERCRWGWRPPRRRCRRRRRYQTTRLSQRRGAPRHCNQAAHRRGRRSMRPPHGSERSLLLCPMRRRPRRRRLLVRHRMCRRVVLRCPSLVGAAATATTVTRSPVTVTHPPTAIWTVPRRLQLVAWLEGAAAAPPLPPPSTLPPLGPAPRLVGAKMGS